MYKLISPYYCLSIDEQSDMMIVYLSWGKSRRSHNNKEAFRKALSFNGIDIPTNEMDDHPHIKMSIGSCNLLQNIDVRKTRYLDNRHNGHKYCQLTKLKYDFALKEDEILDFIKSPEAKRILNQKIFDVKFNFDRQYLLFCSIPATDFIESGKIYIIPAVMCHVNYQDAHKESKTHFIQIITVASIENNTFYDEAFDYSGSTTSDGFDIMKYFVYTEYHKEVYNKEFHDWCNNRNVDEVFKSDNIEFNVFEFMPLRTVNAEHECIYEHDTVYFKAYMYYFVKALEQSDYI